MNLQHILFFLAFITFGIGDASTATIMINAKGPDAEFNNLFGYIYESHSAACFVSVKLVLVIVLLFTAYILSKHGGYWFMCGWLAGVCMGGIMAMISNLGSAYGVIYVNPYNVILCYLVLTFVFLYAGDWIDNNGMNV